MKTYTLRRIRTGFVRVGYELVIYKADGTLESIPLRVWGTPNYPKVYHYDSGPFRFYGDDGRKVRADALAFARSNGARTARHV
jgi:hypothetical protein